MEKAAHTLRDRKEEADKEGPWYGKRRQNKTETVGGKEEEEEEAERMYSVQRDGERGRKH